jgi:alpha-L-fucosidase 2
MIERNFKSGCQIVGMYEDERETWEEMLKHIPPYQLNEDGAVKEWMHPLLKDNYQHRHQSHVYPVFPGYEITEEENPELFSAFVTAIKKRLVIGLTAQTSWSFAHMACNYARMEEGDLALECLDNISRSCIMNNFFTVHNDWRNMGIGLDMNWAPFQIDANMGWTAAIQEMLVFSKPSLIKLLPGLPSRWVQGSISGLLCRGGVTLDIQWDMRSGRIQAWLRGKHPQIVNVKLPGKIETLSVDGASYGNHCGSVIQALQVEAGKLVAIDAVVS